MDAHARIRQLPFARRGRAPPVARIHAPQPHGLGRPAGPARGQDERPRGHQRLVVRRDPDDSRARGLALRALRRARHRPARLPLARDQDAFRDAGRGPGLEVPHEALARPAGASRVRPAQVGHHAPRPAVLVHRGIAGRAGARRRHPGELPRDRAGRGGREVPARAGEPWPRHEPDRVGGVRARDAVHHGVRAGTVRAPADRGRHPGAGAPRGPVYERLAPAHRALRPRRPRHRARLPRERASSRPRRARLGGGALAPLAVGREGAPRGGSVPRRGVVGQRALDSRFAALAHRLDRRLARRHRAVGASRRGSTSRCPTGAGSRTKRTCRTGRAVPARVGSADRVIP